MNTFDITVGIGSVILLLYLLSSLNKTKEEVIEDENLTDKYVPIYEKYGRMFGVDPKLLRAIAIVESSEKPNAVNESDPSYGLMQILCTGTGAQCTNKLNIREWPANRADLLDPDKNVFYGAQILSWNIRHYGRPKGIALYNNWSGNQTAPRNGPFANQPYVDKVMREYTNLL